MKKILLLLVLLVGVFGGVFGQTNHLYKNIYHTGLTAAGDGFICGNSRPNTYDLSISFNSYLFTHSSSANGNGSGPNSDYTGSAVGEFITNYLLDRFSFADNFAYGQDIPLNLGSNVGSVNVNLCGLITSTQWGVTITKLSFNLDNLGSDIICSNKNVTFSIPTYPDNPYFFQATNNPLDANSWQTISSVNTDTITFNQGLLPSTINRGVPTYFRIKGVFAGFDIQSDNLGITFYNGMPTPQTITANKALCASDFGSVAFSNFQNLDGSAYNGGENLSITLTNQASGIPEAPIAFTGTSITIPNLAPGNYIAQINNSTATCASNFSFTIPPAPPPITASITAQNPDCATGTGTITATGGGGTPPYQYSINGGTTYQSSNVFTNLIDGNYSVTIIDANSCGSATSNPVAIVVPTAVNTVLNTKLNPTGFGLSNGQIIVSANGGSGTGYIYAIDGITYLTDDTFNNLAAGTYTITSKDSKGCISPNLSVTLTDPTQLTVSVNAQTNNLCYGTNTGTVDLLATGGTAPYQYSVDGANYQFSTSFNNLAAGNYTLTVKDSASNQVNTTVNITQPAVITANVVKNDAACLGNNGSIVINSPTGGSGSGFTYSINGGTSYESTYIFNVLAGTYQVKIRDGNGCTSSNIEITITQPSTGIQISPVTQNVACAGLASGIVTLNATGGTGGYIYTKDNWASSNTTGVFTELLAGTYNFQIKDQAGCLASLSQTVIEPQELILQINQITHASCFGGTGSFAVSAIGGEGIMSYSSTPTLTLANGVFTGAIAGDYVVKVTDGNGCIKFENVTINNPAQLIGYAVTTMVNCNGSADGTVVLSATGGTGNYSYGIKNSGVYTASNIFNELIAGNYTFSIQDTNGCLADVNAIVTQPTQVSLNVIAKQNVSCKGANNGSFKVTASGGSGNFNYKLNGADNGFNNSFMNLSPGNYVVRVTDANGCFKEISETITEPSSLNLSLVNKKDINCFGSTNGEISVVAFGGLAPYQYALNGANFQSTSSFTGLPAGNYTIQVIDANQCLQTLNVTIFEPQKLTAVLVKKDLKCFGDANGIITMNVSGGEGPYLYSINGSTFQINNTFSNLVEGNYSLTVQDKNNCQLTQLVSIINIAANLTLELLATSPTSCDGLGSIKVNAVNGGTAPYLYSIDGNTYAATQVFDALAAGQYTIFVKDSEGCITSQSQTISVPSGISAQTLATNVSCFSANNGNILIRNVSGGNGNYLYAITGGSFQTSNNFANLTAGNYTIIVKDNPYSCQYSLNASIEQPSKLNLELKSKSDISCNGQSNGKIEVSANGGIAPFQYSIDGGITYSSSGVFSALSAKNYNVLVKDANNCTDHINVLLAEPAILTVLISTKSDVSCFGLKNGSIVLNGNGGTQPYKYSIDNGTQRTSNRFDNLSGGNYLLTLTDANGCTAEISVVIDENPILSLSISSFKNLNCNANASGEISVIAVGGSGAYQYAINNGFYQSFPIFNNLNAGNYNISVKDDKGCIATITKSITEPPLLSLSKTIKQQTCFDVCDGKIQLSVSGGTAPYTYNWSGGYYGNVPALSNLCGGIYKVTIVDANGCSIEDVTDMITPQAIQITNVSDTVLCVDQVVTYDAGNPGFTYVWVADNGFSETTQKVQISKAGNYQLKVTNAIGCSVLKTFTVQTSTTLLKANFLVSTYGNVGDTIIVVDVSKPTPAKTSWMFDSGTTMVGGNASGTIKQISFSNPGVYNMMVMVNLGQCADAVQKSITILAKEQKGQANNALGYREELFKAAKVYPNPTNGEFKAIVKLAEKMELKSSLYGFSGNLIMAPIVSNVNDNFEINFNQTRLPPGMYILTMEAGSQVKTLKIIKL